VHDFVPLDVWLRGEPQAPAAPPLAPPSLAPPCDDTSPEPEPCDVEAAIADARRFRAALADALDAAVAAIARDVATEVLGRELVLAPIDLATIVREAAARIPEIVRVRVHPRDLAELRAAGAPAFADASLRPGDARVDVVDGMHDATLGARLRSVLAGWSLA
jgi:flagellar biosynthesis/type III secretory pathway protein FliH